MNKSLKLLFLFNGIFVFAVSLLGPLYAIYVNGIENDILAVSSSYAVFLITSTIFTLLISKFGDYIEQKEYMLILGFLLRGIVWFGYIYVTSFNFLLLLQILMGIGEAFGTPSYDALLAEHLDNNKHIKDYATWKVISNLSGAIATFFGGLLVVSYGFVPLFIIMGTLAMICTFGLLIVHTKVL